MVDMANVIFSPDSAGIRKTHLKVNCSRVFLAGKTESEDTSIHFGLGLVHRFDKEMAKKNSPESRMASFCFLRSL